MIAWSAIIATDKKRLQNKTRKVMYDETERDKDVNLAGQLCKEVGVNCDKRKNGVSCWYS